MVVIDIDAIAEMTSVDAQRATVLLLHGILERLDKLEALYSAQSSLKATETNPTPPTGG